MDWASIRMTPLLSPSKKKRKNNHGYIKLTYSCWFQNPPFLAPQHGHTQNNHEINIRFARSGFKLIINFRCMRFFQNRLKLFCLYFFSSSYVQGHSRHFLEEVFVWKFHPKKLNIVWPYVIICAYKFWIYI